MGNETNNRETSKSHMELYNVSANINEACNCLNGYISSHYNFLSLLPIRLTLIYFVRIQFIFLTCPTTVCTDVILPILLIQPILARI